MHLNPGVSSFFLSILAAVSLANWSTNEENTAIQDTCTKMYEISMLLSSVIDSFSKEVSRSWLLHSSPIFCDYFSLFVPEPTARSAVRRGLLIPHGYLHPGKCEHSEV